VALAQVKSSAEDMKGVGLAVETHKAAVKQAEASRYLSFPLSNRKSCP